MNFTDAMLTVELVLESGSVPLIVGESGIGKTALINEICKKHGYYYVGIDGNLLKEGEIGGLPTVDEYSIVEDGKEVTKKRTVYAVHTKLWKIQEILKGEPSSKVLLFIDEINRCEHSVQQELMNLVLNREINGFQLPDSVYVAAAMNPSNRYSTFEYTDYQVVDMDPAQEDRFVWINLEADFEVWLKWGLDNGNIHPDVLEFIANFPEYLHTPDSKETVKATPRSWERVSNSYRVYLNNKNRIPLRIFINVLRGNVGNSIAGDFIQFIKEDKKPLIKAEDIFMNGSISSKLKERVKNESHSRLYLASKNALKYLSGKEQRSKEIEIFSEFIQLFPPDLKIGIMQEIKNSYNNTLYREFINNDTFVDGYFI